MKNEPKLKPKSPEALSEWMSRVKYNWDAETKKKIARLIHDLAYHSYLYYEKDAPVISDQEYDNLYNQFLMYKEKYPDLPDPVGSPVLAGEPIKHINPMISLRSFSDIDELLSKWESKIRNKIEELMYFADPKVDGLAIELQYANGKMMKASTRGDGYVGEDVSANVSVIPSIPNQISDVRVVQVYGEVYIDKLTFKQINKMRVKDGNAPFVNSRNAAAGILRSKHYPKSVVKKLKFYPYRLEPIINEVITEDVTWFKDQGFNMDGFPSRECDTADDLKEFVKMMGEKRKNLPVDIDGVVFKIDYKEYQRVMGEGAKHPNWAIAYKFRPDSEVSTISSVTFQVGRTGVIAPVAEIFPVILRGSEVKRATLHNINKIREKDIRIGDKIEVGMMNDVVPGVVRSLHDERDGNEKEIVFPDTCPSCHSELSFDGSRYRCQNHSGCQEQIVGQITYAASRKALNIMGLGKATVKLLVANHVITDIASIFTLDTDENTRNIIQHTLGLGKKKTVKLAKAIDDARVVPFNKFLKCLGIENVSTGIATAIAEKFVKWDNFHTCTNMHEILSSIKNINTGTVTDIVNYFNDPDRLALVEKLFDNGVIVRDHITPNKTGLRVAFTGKFDRKRSDMEERVRSIGGRVDKKVTKKTNYLVVGKNPRSKLEIATKLNIPILTESSFEETL